MEWEQTLTLSKPQHLFESANESIMTRSMEGRINYWNRSAEKLYGWRKDEAIGRVSHDLLRTQFPKPLEDIESELVHNGRWEGKLVHTTRGGARLVVESRWTIDGQSGPVVEINARSTDPSASRDTGRVEIGRQEPAPTSKLMKANDLLPKIANIVLAGGAFLCVLAGCYALTRHFSPPIGKLLYGFLPISLGGLLFVSLKFKPSQKVNLAVFCVSLAASVYGMDLFLRLLDSTPKGPLMLDLRHSSDKENDAVQLSKKFGVQIDSRNPSEVIADLNKSHVGVIPFVSPGNNLFVERDGYKKSVISVGGAEIIPLAGISNKLTLLCNESGQWVSYKSDAHGFNNPDMVVWKSAGVDIAALGDSFTQGYCVPPDKSFMGLIRQRYPMALNLGIAGDGPLMMLATMKEYLDAIKPKIILWFYCEDNDLVDLQGERKSELLTRYLDSDFNQGLVARQTDIDDAMTKDIPRLEALERENQIRRQQRPTVKDELVDMKEALVDIVKLAALRIKLNMPRGIDTRGLAALTDMEGPNLDVFAKILAQAKSRVIASNGKMYFVYLPSWARYAKFPLEGIKQRARVLSIVNSLQIPIIDIDQTFDAQEDPLSLFPFREPGHYNEIGHRLVAEEVIKHLSFQQATR